MTVLKVDRGIESESSCLVQSKSFFTESIQKYNVVVSESNLKTA